MLGDLPKVTHSQEWQSQSANLGRLTPEHTLLPQADDLSKDDFSGRG